MKISQYQVARKEKEIQKAYLLYKQGLPLREVGKIMERSHEWVRSAVEKLSTEEVDKL